MPFRIPRGHRPSLGGRVGEHQHERLEGLPEAHLVAEEAAAGVAGGCGDEAEAQQSAPATGEDE